MFFYILFEFGAIATPITSMSEVIIIRFYSMTYAMFTNHFYAAIFSYIDSKSIFRHLLTRPRTP